MKYKLRKILFFFIIISFQMILIELFSFVLLATSVIEINATQLIHKFPAQLRMDGEDIIKEFPALSPIQRAGQFLGFQFDPVMGFQKPEAIEWYGDRQRSRDDTFLIVTFGGSTTVHDNWPKYLIEYAKKEKVRGNIVVLNAGLWGYMTFNEKIYFSSWIFPMLREKGISPDLILSLDGVNDIWYRILGYLEAEKMNAPIWFNQYHGYHQHHDSDMRIICTTSGAFKQLLANLSKEWYRTSIQFIPYTMKLLEALIRKKAATSVHYISDIPVNVKTRKLDISVEENIIIGYEDNLVDFFAEANARDIRFVAYLQPVISGTYYPFKIPSSFFFPGIDYMGISLKQINSQFTRLYCDDVIQTAGLYKRAEVMYNKLNNKYPGSFKSIINAFQGVDDPEALFQKDAIHYNQYGKELIAHLIIKDLIGKKILSTEAEDN